jgi:hypothetical protein
MAPTVGGRHEVGKLRLDDEGPEPSSPSARSLVVRGATQPGGELGAGPASAGTDDRPDREGDGDAEWAVARLRFGAVAAARIMLSFGGDVEVVSPPEVRADLAAVAARTVVRYAGAEPE